MKNRKFECSNKNQCTSNGWCALYILKHIVIWTPVLGHTNTLQLVILAHFNVHAEASPIVALALFIVLTNALQITNVCRQKFPCYVVFFLLQIATIAVNYEGHPFRESLTENRSLMGGLVFATIGTIGLVFGALADNLELVPLDNDVRCFVPTFVSGCLTWSFVLECIAWTASVIPICDHQFFLIFSIPFFIKWTCPYEEIWTFS